jgi:hypothetical protein
MEPDRECLPRARLQVLACTREQDDRFRHIHTSSACAGALPLEQWGCNCSAHAGPQHRKFLEQNIAAMNPTSQRGPSSARAVQAPLEVRHGPPRQYPRSNKCWINMHVNCIVLECHGTRVHVYSFTATYRGSIAYLATAAQDRAGSLRPSRERRDCGRANFQRRNSSDGNRKKKTV